MKIKLLYHVLCTQEHKIQYFRKSVYFAEEQQYN